MTSTVQLGVCFGFFPPSTVNLSESLVSGDIFHVNWTFKGVSERYKSMCFFILKKKSIYIVVCYEKREKRKNIRLGRVRYNQSDFRGHAFILFKKNEKTLQITF